MTYDTNSPEETIELGKKLATTFSPGLVILSGDLGLGKTTFIKGLALGLGIENQITSPTFVLLKVYEVGSWLHSPRCNQRGCGAQVQSTEQDGSTAIGSRDYTSASGLWSQRASIKKLIHIDAYRLENFSELVDLSLEDWLHSGDSLIVMEWGEKFGKDLEKYNPVKIVFKETEREKRTIDIS